MICYREELFTIHNESFDISSANKSSLQHREKHDRKIYSKNGLSVYCVTHPLGLFTTSLNVVRMCVCRTEARGLGGLFCYALLMIMCLEQKMLTLIYFIMSNNLLEMVGWRKNERSNNTQTQFGIVQAAAFQLKNILFVCFHIFVGY